MIEQLNSFFSTLSGMVWGVPVLALLVGTGILLTVRLRGLQFRKLFYALGLMFGNHDDEPGDISSFQALMTALAATIGTPFQETRKPWESTPSGLAWCAASPPP